MLFSLEGKTAKRIRFPARKRLSSTILRESLCPALTSSWKIKDSFSNNNLKSSKRQNKINEVS